MKTFSVRIIVLLAFALFVPMIMWGQDVNTDYNKSTDFTKYKTFTWGKGTPAANPLMYQRIVAGVESRLDAKGLTNATDPTTADLLVAYHASVDTETQINTMGGGWRWGGMGSATVDKIPVGQLIVDMGDIKTQTFIWRGTASSTLSSNPDKVEKTLNKALDKMFKDFPPSASK